MPWAPTVPLAWVPHPAADVCAPEPQAWALTAADMDAAVLPAANQQ